MGGLCRAGTYCPQGSAEPIACDGGSYCDQDELAAPTGFCDAGKLINLINFIAMIKVYALVTIGMDSNRLS